MTGTVIEDLGKWDWRLEVEPDGRVVARQPIPYDGVLIYSTEDRPNKPRARSEFGLGAREVVRRYARASDTDRTFGELIDAVQVALGRVEA